MNGTVILKCNCKHRFQDRRYGIGKRVHNYISGKEAAGSGKSARCTVCSSVKQA